jgi:hypothetical protein
VQYLGHTVLLEGITTDPKKLKYVQEWSPLKDKREMWSFLCLCTCSRRVIAGFVAIAKPLNNSQKKSGLSCGLQRGSP